MGISSPIPPGRALTQEEAENLFAVGAVVSGYPWPGRFNPHDPQHRMLFVALDGTGQNADARSSDVDSNAASLARMVQGTASANPRAPAQIVAHYWPGIGAGRQATQWLAAATGEGLTELTEQAYLAIAQQVASWRQDDPNVQIHLAFTGFSRGAAAVLHLANLIDQRGIADPASARLISEADPWGEYPQQRTRIVYDQTLLAPGTARINGLFLADTVVTGQSGMLMLTVPPIVDSVLHLVARDEPRNLMFRLQSILSGPGAYDDPRLVEVSLDGAHGDVGGGYDHGLGAAALQLAADYLNAIGAGMAGAVPAHLAVADPFVVHDSSWPLTPVAQAFSMRVEPDWRRVDYRENPAVPAELLEFLYPTLSSSASSSSDVFGYSSGISSWSSSSSPSFAEFMEPSTTPSFAHEVPIMAETEIESSFDFNLGDGGGWTDPAAVTQSPFAAGRGEFDVRFAAMPAGNGFGFATGSGGGSGSSLGFDSANGVPAALFSFVSVPPVPFWPTVAPIPVAGFDASAYLNEWFASPLPMSGTTSLPNPATTAGSGLDPGGLVWIDAFSGGSFRADARSLPVIDYRLVPALPEPGLSTRHLDSVRANVPSSASMLTPYQLPAPDYGLVQGVVTGPGLRLNPDNDVWSSLFSPSPQYANPSAADFRLHTGGSAPGLSLASFF